MKGAVRLGVLAIAGAGAFTLSWFLPQENPPEPPLTDIHSEAELLRLLPGPGDIPDLHSIVTNDIVDGVTIPSCLPQKVEDVAPPYIRVAYDLYSGSDIAVAFTRIGPGFAGRARYLLRSAKQRCSEKGHAYEGSPEGTWTFQQVKAPRIGELSVAFTGKYLPPSDFARDSEAWIVYAISKEWTITFTVNKAAPDEMTNEIMSRILTGLDAHVGSVFAASG
ncbi:hypothetical protein [Streptosporangium sp. NPDC051022]|uniref:hypothetical protein n=1 Tax=Streptosporangium sp. NPDC051022 TaxID=3155752 RepID=UPI00342213F2